MNVRAVAKEVLALPVVGRLLHMRPVFQGLLNAYNWCRRLNAPRLTLIDDLKTVAAQRGWKYSRIAGEVIQRSVPSRTIPEVTAELLSDAELRVGAHFRRRERGAERIRRLWYGQLLGVFRYPVYETFTCETPDVYVGVPNGEVVSPQLEGFTQSSRLEWDDVVWKPPQGARKLEGRYISLLGWAGNNYGHWLVDVLTRLSLVSEDELGDYRYLLSEKAAGFREESVRLLGIRPDQIVRLPEGWHQVERLLVCHHAQRCMIAKHQHLMDLRSRLSAAVFPRGERPVPHRRIYISRARAGGRRRVVNEEEMIPILEAHGFERVFCEDLSFQDQVRLFGETRVLMGVHGAGMNNSVLCEPGATVIELYNEYCWNYCTRGIANTMGHEHWFMFGHNINRHYDMRVDPQLLAKLLSCALDDDRQIESEY